MIETFPSVWIALGHSPDEAANLELRAELMVQLQGMIRANGWTQAVAAKHCGVSQPRVNDLIKGRISRFSLDALVNIASTLGQRIEVFLKAA